MQLLYSCIVYNKQKQISLENAGIEAIVTISFMAYMAKSFLTLKVYKRQLLVTAFCINKLQDH